jgi:peptidoglycan/LPS O-acetylase OafA/YrhL
MIKNIDSNNYIKATNKKKILGIEILRFILCFMVVFDHLYKGNQYIYMLYYHIPTFFIHSIFYMVYHFMTYL